jgi:hypothetical protein
MKKLIMILTAVGISFSTTSPCAQGASGARAQALPSVASETKTPLVRKRQVRQQRRINQGVESGELMKRETLRLEKEAYEIQQAKKQAKSDGDVTRRERVGLRRELNQSSRHIYRAKHNNRRRGGS